jgi:peptidoglycan/xylan/chitin deacetylase (PgdA/CDA1 family)
MKRVFYAFSPLWAKIPISIWTALTRQRLLLPFYHCVSDRKPAHIKHLYQVKTEKQFVRDLDFITKHFKPIGADEIMASVKNDRPLPQKSFLLTFDDGLREFHDVVAPILLKKGIPAICFVNSGFADNKALFYRYKQSLLYEHIVQKSIENKTFQEKSRSMGIELASPADLLLLTYEETEKLNHLATELGLDYKAYLQEYRPYMTRQQIMELAQKGFCFGGHSIDHPKYTKVPLQEQIRQTHESIDFVNEIAPSHYRLFSFPFTDDGVKKEFFELVLSGEPPIADITFACAGIKKDDFTRNIQRIPAEIGHYNLMEVISAEYAYYAFRSLFNKNKVKH